MREGRDDDEKKKRKKRSDEAEVIYICAGLGSQPISICGVWCRPGSVWRWMMDGRATFFFWLLVRGEARQRRQTGPWIMVEQWHKWR